MKRLIRCVIILSSYSPVALGAQETSGSRSITVIIKPITVLSVSGDPQPFVTNNVTSTEPPFFHDRSTSYNLTTNEENVVLRAHIDAPLPPGVHVTMSAEPSLGIAMAEQELITANLPVDLVTDIGPGLENNRILYYDVHYDTTYQFSGILERTITVSLCVSDLSRCSKSRQKIVLGSASNRADD